MSALALDIRLRRAALALGTIALGLLVHLGGDTLAPVVRDILGDALWAVMMFCWVGVLAPFATLRTRAAWTLGICFAVELSQRYRTPALDALRRTRAGHLLLGSGFDPRDFAAYTAGVLLAVVIAHTARHLARRRRGQTEGSS